MNFGAICARVGDRRDGGAAAPRRPTLDRGKSRAAHSRNNALVVPLNQSGNPSGPRPIWDSGMVQLVVDVVLVEIVFERLGITVDLLNHRDGALAKVFHDHVDLPSTSGGVAGEK
eukprot:4923830-Pyramimonas_sp.AAC.1